MQTFSPRLRKAVTAVALAVAAASSAVHADDKPKNIILMIGDGMGPQQIGLLETYARQAPNSIYQGRDTGLHKLSKDSVLGLSMTNPEDTMVVDSACSASHLATGQMAPSEALAVDLEGNPVETVLEKAKRLGKATGLVSDTRITHATPAAFASHQPHRSLENEIAVDLLENGVDVLLSGGLRNWIPQSVNEKGKVHQEVTKLTGGAVSLSSSRKDERNLLTEAKQSGYELAFDRSALNKADGTRLLGLFASSGMEDGITYSRTKNDANRQQPSLREMAMKALDILSKDEDGFFLVIEGGQIDWAGHNNDAGTMLHEMLRFDEAVAAVHEWAQKRQDTLMVVTADHETGSFGFSYSASDLPKASKLPGKAFENRDYHPNFNFGPISVLDGLYNQGMSFGNMWAKFKKLPAKDQTADNLAKIVNDNSDFKITSKQAARVMQVGPNPYYVAGHPYMKLETVPVIDDFSAFYVYGNEVHFNLLGRAMATDQNVVWGTGTHTTTPVTVMAHGKGDWTASFSRIQHHTDVGAALMNAL